MWRKKGVIVHMQTPVRETSVLEQEYLKTGARARTVNLSERIRFGKHKGKTFKSVLSIEPSYLLWAHKNNIITLPKRIYQRAKAGADWEKYEYLCDTYIDRCCPYDE